AGKADERFNYQSSEGIMMSEDNHPQAVKSPSLISRIGIPAVVMLAWVALAGSRQIQTDVLRVPELDAGFRLLYELKPAEARAQFAARQQTHPEDPLSSAAEAASYLFEEFYRQGILTSEFFLDDDRFMGETPLKAEAALRKAFFTASKRAQDLAQLRLKTNPDDANALFALTICVGMRADYTSMMDKKYLDSLRLIREA